MSLLSRACHVYICRNLIAIHYHTVYPYLLLEKLLIVDICMFHHLCRCTISNLTVVGGPVLESKPLSLLLPLKVGWSASACVVSYCLLRFP